MNLAPLWLSLQVALIATTLAGVLGVGLAAWLSRVRGGWRDVVEALLTAPMVLPPTVLGWLLLVVLGRSGPISRVVEAIFGGPLVFSPAALVVAGTLAALPFVVKSSRTAFDDVDHRLVAAASTLGASPARVFLTVVLPLSRGGVMAGLTLGFARALGDFGVTLMIAGNIPGHTQTASLALYDAVTAGQHGDALGLGLVLGATGIAALVVGGRLGRRRPHAW